LLAISRRRRRSHHPRLPFRRRSTFSHAFFFLSSFSQNRPQSVQTFGRKKTAVAVAHVKRGKGLLKLNGKSGEKKTLQSSCFSSRLALGFEFFRSPARRA